MQALALLPLPYPTRVALMVQRGVHLKLDKTTILQEIAQTRMVRAPCARAVYDACCTPDYNVGAPFTDMAPDPTFLGLDPDVLFPVLHRFEASAEVRARWEQKVREIAAVPQNEQRSPEWYAQRMGAVTASDIATCAGESHYNSPDEVLLKKCGRGIPFSGNMYTHHGVLYEPVATEVYEHLYRIKVHEFGLIPHGAIPSHSEPTEPLLAASPDGIGGGIMLEIKCPMTRQPTRYVPDVHGVDTDGDGVVVPHGYFSQIQSQLACCDLDVCDFLECKFYEYPTRDAFYNDVPADAGPRDARKAHRTSTHKLKGVVLKFRVLDAETVTYHYEYPPNMFAGRREQQRWITDTLKHADSSVHAFERLVHWRLNDVFVFRVYRDPQFIAERMPVLRKFWERVERGRTDPAFLDEVEKAYYAAHPDAGVSRTPLLDKCEELGTCLLVGGAADNTADAGMPVYVADSSEEEEDELVAMDDVEVQVAAQEEAAKDDEFDTVTDKNTSYAFDSDSD